MNNQNKNINLWKSVDTTDAQYTKPMKFGAKLTAIDAHYQLLKATETFGPMGIGWGTKDSNYQVIDKIVIYTAKLWYIYEGQEGMIEIASEYPIQNDCVKSVTTDAITKGLSKLGFNADVFLNKFDGNKYVGADSANQVSVTTSLEEGWHLQPIGFGKYKNESWKDVAEKDSAHIAWIAKNSYEQINVEKANKCLQAIAKKKADAMKAKGGA